MTGLARVLAASILVSLVSASPARAITFGEHDNGEHPYVGFLVFFVPDGDEPGWFSCSGSLLDSSTLLTAGHCAFGVGTGGAPTTGGSGGNDVWVSLDESIDFAGAPHRADFSDDASYYAALSAWLDANPHFTRGTSIPHPKYDGFLEFPNDHDVGVILLDEPSSVTTFAKLPRVGKLDALAAKGGGHNKIIVETAGYGIQQVKPTSIQLDERWKSTSTIVNLRSHLTDGFNVHTSNNPSAAHGRGGSCFGDSGGGVFLNDTNTVVAVVSFGQNDNCKGADYSARTDVTDVQSFLAGFLGD